MPGKFVLIDFFEFTPLIKLMFDWFLYHEMVRNWLNYSDVINTIWILITYITNYVYWMSESSINVDYTIGTGDGDWFLLILP